MQKQLLGSLAAVSLAIGAAGAGQAAPIPYLITGGEILVSASSGGAFLTEHVALPLVGYVVVDLDPGSEQITSLYLESTGSVEVALADAVGGYQMLRVDQLSIFGGHGGLTLLGAVGSELEYFALLEDLKFSTTFALVDDVLPDDPGAMSLPLDTGTGTLFATVSDRTLTLDGFAIADFVYPGPDLPITVTTIFRFEAAAIPEPTAAVIFAAGLIPIAGALRRSRARRS